MELGEADPLDGLAGVLLGHAQGLVAERGGGGGGEEGAGRGGAADPCAPGRPIRPTSTGARIPAPTRLARGRRRGLAASGRVG